MSSQASIQILDRFFIDRSHALNLIIFYENLDGQFFISKQHTMLTL